MNGISLVNQYKKIDKVVNIYETHLHVPYKQSKEHQTKNCNDDGEDNLSNISTCGKSLSQAAA